MTWPLLKHAPESIIYDLDCTRELADGETITGITSVVADAITGSTAPSITGAVVNTVAVTYSYGIAAIGKVIQARIAGGSAAEWTISALYTTSLGNSRKTVVKLQID